MNAVTTTEARDVNAAATTAANTAANLLQAADPSKHMILVPLSRLVSRPTGRNVRKSVPRMSIPELAASVQRVGLLQNLIVIPAADGEHYEVVAGGRRLAALKLLAKKHRIAKDWQVPCLRVADGTARTASLTENVQREAMQAVVHRGLLREAEAKAKALRTLEKLRNGFAGTDASNDEGGEETEQSQAASMSDRLAQRLSAHRTAALQIEVARHPQMALAALVHGMVQTVLQDRYYGHDLPLGVRLTVQDRLEGMAPDWPESPAAVALRELQQAAGGTLPQDSAELFAALLAKPQDDLVRLLAVCLASTVDVVTPRATPHQPGQELAQTVGLDMAAWWTPSTDGYFRHVPKAVILEAVGEFAPDHVNRLAKLKKADIASEAERLAAGTGWMPAIFRTTGPEHAAQEVRAETAQDAATAMDKQPQAETAAV